MLAARHLYFSKVLAARYLYFNTTVLAARKNNLTTARARKNTLLACSQRPFDSPLDRAHFKEAFEKCCRSSVFLQFRIVLQLSIPQSQRLFSFSHTKKLTSSSSLYVQRLCIFLVHVRPEGCFCRHLAAL